MKKGSYELQKRIKQHNRSRILGPLESGPSRFKELLEVTELSPMGLTRILDELVHEGRIKKVTHDGHQSYALTKGGLDELMELKQTGYLLKQIQEGGGNYHNDYSGMRDEMLIFDQTWGIEDDLYVDKRLDSKTNPITKQIAAEMHQMLYERVRDLIKSGKIKADKFIDGDVVLSFMINYKRLMKSIQENSLEYYKNVSDKEIEVINKIEKETATEKDMEMLEKVREETRQKAKEMANK